MGLDFLRDKKVRFEQKRDELRKKELEDEDLITLSRAHHETYLFTCELSDPSTVVILGYRLVIRVHTENEITVSQNGRTIGHVIPDDIGELMARLKANRHHTGVLTVLAASHPDMDGHFLVKPIKPFKY